MSWLRWLFPWLLAPAAPAGAILRFTRERRNVVTLSATVDASTDPLVTRTYVTVTPEGGTPFAVDAAPSGSVAVATIKVAEGAKGSMTASHQNKYGRKGTSPPAAFDVATLVPTPAAPGAPNILFVDDAPDDAAAEATPTSA